MDLEISHRNVPSPMMSDTVAPRVMRRIEERSSECPIHVAQQAARAELMLLRGVTSSAEYVTRLGVDSVEAADKVLGVVRTKWASGDHGVTGRGRQLAALDLASNEMMLARVFGTVRGHDRHNLQRQHVENRQRRAELLDRSPKLQAVTVTTPARITLASRRFRAVTAQLDRLTIAAELMIERSELIQTDSSGDLSIVRVLYLEA